MPRRILLVLAMVALAVCGWFSIQVYRSKADPESFAAWDGRFAWIVGPSGRDLLLAADDRMEQALEVLASRSMSPGKRIADYHAHLEAAERLLVRSLKAQPAQAGALAKLAAVRWELDPPFTEPETRRFLDMIAVASEMAPSVPEVQLQLGELLLKMGRRKEAGTYLRRTVALSPARARDAVAILRENLVPIDEILETLPVTPETMVAMYTLFGTEDRLDRFVELTEPILGNPAPQLLYFYGNACLQSKMPGRLLESMNRLTFEDARLEAERFRVRSRARNALGDVEGALQDALRACELQPGEAVMKISLGEMYRNSGRYEEAIREFRSALSLIARTRNPNPAWRAGIYTKIGHVEDLRNRPDLAFDAYSKAVELNPGEPYAAKRLQEMREAAGFHGPGP